MPCEVLRPGLAPVTSLSALPSGSRVCVSCARRRLLVASRRMGMGKASGACLRFPALHVEECRELSVSTAWDSMAKCHVSVTP